MVGRETRLTRGGKKLHLQRGRGFQTLHGFDAWLPMWMMIPSVSMNLEENASDFSQLYLMCPIVPLFNHP